MSDVSGLIPQIDPKEIKIKNRKGEEKIFIISLIPATYSREIIAKWTANILPKMGEYSINEEMMFKIMSYVAIPVKGGQPLRLTTRELVDNHVLDLKTLETIEKEMAEYNWGFFLGDELSNLKERFFRIFNIWLTQILTASFRQSSQTEKLASTN